MTSPLSPKPGMNVRYVDATGAIGPVTVAAVDGDAITIPGVEGPVPYDEARGPGSWHLSASLRASLPRAGAAQVAAEAVAEPDEPAVPAVPEPAETAPEPKPKPAKGPKGQKGRKL